jgi:capsular polysaccharide biosynthesis protein
MWGEPFRNTWLNIFDSPQTHYYISDCIVDYETGLIYKDGQIFWEAANENMVWYDGWISGDPRWLNRITRQDVISDRMKKLTAYIEEKINKAEAIPQVSEGPTLHLLHPFNRYVFGHIFDTLQKLYVVEKENLNFQSILIPNTHEIIDFELHLAALNLNHKQIFTSDRGLVRVSQLLFILPVGHPTSFVPDSYLFIRNKYQKFFGVEANPVAEKKIFLTRRSGDFKRYLINDKEIEEKLKAIGVLYFDGKQTFKEIVESFAHASHVCGVHGSLFTNNIYGNDKTKYLEYCPIARENHTFHHQYKLCASYQHLLVEGDKDNNISLKIEDLIEFFSK